MSIAPTQRRQSVAVQNAERPYSDSQRFDRNHEGRKRLRQLKRVIHVANIVKRDPCSTVSEIYRAMRNEFGFDICCRTVIRDLNALVDLQVIEVSSQVVVNYKNHERNMSVYQFSDDLNLWAFGGDQ